MTKPKYLRFSKFKSEQSAANDEAQRLLKLRKQIKRLKRQRIFITVGACAVTALIVYLVAGK